jgi:hypothetical protein
MNKVQINNDLEEIELLKKVFLNLSRSMSSAGLFVNNPG